MGNPGMGMQQPVVVQQPVMQPDEAQLRQTFKMFDKDGNGFITKEELRKTMLDFGSPLPDS